MLKIIHVILSIIVLGLALFELITNDYQMMPIMMFFLGALMLVLGIRELQKEKRKTGVLSVIVSLFVFFVVFNQLWMS